MAYEVATHHDLPLDVLVVGKIGAPGQPELAMGAVGEGGVVVRNDQVVRVVGATDTQFEAAASATSADVDAKALLVRDSGPPTLADKTVIVVDDGIATGATAMAASEVARDMGAKEVWLAAPVAPDGVERMMAGHFDRVVTVQQPRSFGAVGAWYDDFSQVEVNEVRELLARARLR